MSKTIKITRKPSVLMMVVFGILAFSFYKLVVVDRMGFCYKRLWFVSSEELVLKTIDELMKSGQMKLEPADISPQAYLANHPNCCSVNWGGGPFDRGLIYFGSASVMVSYETSKEGFSNYADKYYDFYSNKTACGETVGQTGSGESKPIEYRPASNQ